MSVRSQKTRFAVIGLGHIGKRHAEMILQNPDSELVAVADIKPADQTHWQGDQPYFSSLTELLNAPIEAEVLTIATPNGLHASMAIEALKKGFHVVIEKPMALRATDAQQIMDAARVAQKEVFNVMQNRYSPPSVWLKELVDSGKLGNIYMVQLNCYWNRDARYYIPGNWHGTPDLDGGVLFTQFSHFIDMMIWLFGDITRIQAKHFNFNHQQLTSFSDSGIATFEFVQGGIGSLNYSTSIWDKNMESSMTIVAEKGSVRIGGQYMEKLEYCHIKDYPVPVLPATNPGNDYGHYKGSAQNHHYVIQNVIDVLHHRAEVATRAEEGLKVVEVIGRLYNA